MAVSDPGWRSTAAAGAAVALRQVEPDLAQQLEGVGGGRRPRAQPVVEAHARTVWSGGERLAEMHRARGPGEAGAGGQLEAAGRDGAQRAARQQLAPHPAHREPALDRVATAQ